MKDVNTRGQEIKETAEMLSDNLLSMLVYAYDLQRDDESYGWGKELEKWMKKFQSYTEQIETFFSEPIE